MKSIPWALLVAILLARSATAETREVLILRAQPDQIRAALSEILISTDGSIEHLIDLEPLRAPHDQYSRLEIRRREQIWPSGRRVTRFTEQERSIYEELLSKLGVPKHHRLPLKGNDRLSPLKAQRIGFRLEYDKNLYNPVGLVPLTLLGSDGPFVGYVDVHIGDRLLGLIEACKRLGLKLLFTSAFRPAPKQWQLYRNAATNPYPVAEPGQSLHEAGFAFDIQIHHWNKTEYRTFQTLAQAFGFQSLSGDPIHFQADPVDFSYPNRESAIRKNQIDYYQYTTDPTGSSDPATPPSSNRSIEPADEVDRWVGAIGTNLVETRDQINQP